MAEQNSDNHRDEIPGMIAGTGGLAGMLAALTVLALVAIAAFWLIGTHGAAASAPGMTIAVEAAAQADRGATAPRGEQTRR